MDAGEALPIWCIVANVVDERPYGPGGAERRRGLRRFAPGAKVWVPDGFAGIGYETVTVIGRPRGSQRYSIVHVRTEHLTNWRIRPVYSPAVRARIDEVCWSVHHGFSAEHGNDRTSEDYRADLAAFVERFRRTEKSSERLSSNDGGDGVSLP
ncbi:hypothetical protein GCM10010168_62890 [Actinoplanes ianthinogenes]|uniref:Uncharacterized protein n=1 Tax=Actinoplanes ianthinogenes TaxID=122358 RepID=A0ABM7LJY7_9ACTN|nr:hypothetical protein [Actinoplanes ianthinogenes]BCJ39463.1 hypothetical protein Aiant_01200 [Actinoplanes ianthinogenes]GGR35922.1 hypothetical protein GCM10010168_62890 [Actinoplanes ianthinogenes]